MDLPVFGQQESQSSLEQRIQPKKDADGRNSQGVLSPILFLFFMTDLLKNVHTAIDADDLVTLVFLGNLTTANYRPQGALLILWISTKK